MKISDLLSAEKYASALVPPNVSWRTLRRCFSEGRLRGVPGVWTSRLPTITPLPTVWVWPISSAEPMSSVTISKARTKCDLDISCFDLLSLFKLHGCGDGLAIPQHLDFNFIADLAAAQGISKVVQIFDGRCAELHQDVAGLKSGLCR